jgi:hypothetical protein
VFQHHPVALLDQPNTRQQRDIGLLRSYTAAMNNSSSALVLEPLFAFLSYSLSTLESTFYKLPGSAVIARYVKSSHQNDPGRTLLELILIIFAIRTLLQSRTRTDRTGKHFIQFSEKVSVLCGPRIVPF